MNQFVKHMSRLYFDYIIETYHILCSYLALFFSLCTCQRTAGAYIVPCSPAKEDHVMGHFSRCVCARTELESDRYINRLIRIIDALDNNDKELDPDEEALAKRARCATQSLTDEQLSTLEKKLFGE